MTNKPNLDLSRLTPEVMRNIRDENMRRCAEQAQKIPDYSAMSDAELTMALFELRHETSPESSMRLPLTLRGMTDAELSEWNWRRSLAFGCRSQAEKELKRRADGLSRSESRATRLEPMAKRGELEISPWLFSMLALTWPAVAIFNLGEYMGWW